MPAWPAFSRCMLTRAFQLLTQTDMKILCLSSDVERGFQTDMQLDSFSKADHIKVNGFLESSPHSAVAHGCSCQGWRCGAQPARPVHLPQVERGHLLFDPSAEGLHMRVLPPALCADEVIGSTRAQGELNWYHEPSRA
jgi:hypothetical protein